MPRPQGSGATYPRCQLTAEGSAPRRHSHCLPAAPGSRPTPQTAFSSGVLWEPRWQERRKEQPRGLGGRKREMTEREREGKSKKGAGGGGGGFRNGTEGRGGRWESRYRHGGERRDRRNKQRQEMGGRRIKGGMRKGKTAQSGRQRNTEGQSLLHQGAASLPALSATPAHLPATEESREEGPSRQVRG